MSAAVSLGSASSRADDTAAPDQPPPAPSTLEARVRALEARVAREREEKAATPPVLVSGYVHVDWVPYRQSSQDEVSQDGAPLNEDRFVLRRARLRAERDAGYVHGAFEIDANTVTGPQLRPINAEASFKWPARRPYARAPWALDPAGARNRSVDGPDPTAERGSATSDAGPLDPWFMVTAGLFRTPFGFEVQESERQRPWLERATMSTALFPQSFDLGVRVVGGFAFVRYALGVMNGAPIGERAFPGRDPNASKDLVFRVGAATAVTDRAHVEAGFSGLTGQGLSPGRPATKDVIHWIDSNDDRVVDPSELDLTPGAPATPSQSFKRFAIGADLRAAVTLPVLGELGFRAEIVRAQNLDRGVMISDPIAATRDLRQLGWYIGVWQEVTRWALVAVRYDRYTPDADAREQTPFSVVPRDPSMSTWSFSATGRAGSARLVAQYDRRTNALGRDASGAPATLADDSFTLRAEARF